MRCAGRASIRPSRFGSAIACDTSPRFGDTRPGDGGWETKFRGPILIHASQARTDAGITCWHDLQVYKRPPFRGMKFEQLPFGAFVGAVEITGCTDTTELLENGQVKCPSEEFHMGDFSPDRFGWTCVNPRPLPSPIKWAGRQRIFNVNLETSAQLQEAVAALGIFNSDAASPLVAARST